MKTKIQYNFTQKYLFHTAFGLKMSYVKEEFTLKSAVELTGEQKTEIISNSIECLIKWYSLYEDRSEEQNILLTNRIEAEFASHFKSDESQFAINMRDGKIIGSAVLYNRGSYVRICQLLIDTEFNLEDIGLKFFQFIKGAFDGLTIYGLINTKLIHAVEFYKSLGLIEGDADLIANETEETRTSANGWISIRSGEI